MRVQIRDVLCKRFEPAPLDAEVTKEAVYFLTEKRKFKFPITPPFLRDHGNYVISLNRFVKWMGSKVEETGITIFTGFAGSELLFGQNGDGDRVTGVQTGERAIACDDLVLATGPWVAETELWLGIKLPVEPVKGELLLMRLPDAPPLYDFTWQLTSLYRRRQNEVWVGVTMKNCGFDCTPTAEAKEFLLDGAARIMPGIRSAKLLDHIAALRPMTASSMPIAGRADGWRNVYIANGGGSKGVLLSVGIAGRVRDLLLDRQTQY